MKVNARRRRRVASQRAFTAVSTPKPAIACLREILLEELSAGIVGALH
jgi:hypothetical protein